MEHFKRERVTGCRVMLRCLQATAAQRVIWKDRWDLEVKERGQKHQEGQKPEHHRRKGRVVRAVDVDRRKAQNWLENDYPLDEEVRASKIALKARLELSTEHILHCQVQGT